MQINWKREMHFILLKKRILVIVMKKEKKMKNKRISILTHGNIKHPSKKFDDIH